MENKAKYKGSVRRTNEPYLDMFFEYRGHEYIVVRPLSWTACSSDYMAGGSMTEAKQHRRAQDLIDGTIDSTPEDPEEEKRKAEEGQKKLQEAMDMFWDSVGL